MKRPTHCLGPCGRRLVSSGHKGTVPPGSARHAGHGLCTACYQSGAGPTDPEARIDLTLPYAVWLPPAWTEQAVCAQTDPEVFHPEKGGSTKAAKDVCATCPVIAECLDYALDHRERYGIWGGASERERRVLLASRRAAA